MGLRRVFSPFFCLQAEPIPAVKRATSLGSENGPQNSSQPPFQVTL
jgi:hypothetical protein